MESQPQNPEFRNNPENIHPCTYALTISGHQIHELSVRESAPAGLILQAKVKTKLNYSPVLEQITNPILSQRSCCIYRQALQASTPDTGLYGMFLPVTRSYHPFRIRRRLIFELICVSIKIYVFRNPDSTCWTAYQCFILPQ